MPHSDDESQSEASYGSVHEYTSDEENEPEDTLHDRKQRLLALLQKNGEFNSKHVIHLHSDELINLTKAHLTTSI